MTALPADLRAYPKPATVEEGLRTLQTMARVPVDLQIKIE